MLLHSLSICIILSQTDLKVLFYLFVILVFLNLFISCFLVFESLVSISEKSFCDFSFVVVQFCIFEVYLLWFFGLLSSCFLLLVWGVHSFEGYFWVRDHLFLWLFCFLVACFSLSVVRCPPLNRFSQNGYFRAFCVSGFLLLFYCCKLSVLRFP